MPKGDKRKTFEEWLKEKTLNGTYWVSPRAAKFANLYASECVKAERARCAGLMAEGIEKFKSVVNEETK